MMSSTLPGTVVFLGASTIFATGTGGSADVATISRPRDLRLNDLLETLEVFVLKVREIEWPIERAKEPYA